VGVIVLGAKMAKADGVVTDDEVNAFKEVFKIPAGEMKNVAQIFNMAKRDVTGYEVYAEQLASMLKGNRALLQDVLEGLFHIATCFSLRQRPAFLFGKDFPGYPGCRETIEFSRECLRME
jgi:uncharacterized tellurite resistance protein B-like protein